MSNSNIFTDLETSFPSAPGPGPAGEAPPPYSTLPVGPNEAIMWSSPHAIASPIPMGYSPVGMKLNYMDFVPCIVRKRLIGNNIYDSFSTLMQRANNWLAEHSDLQLISVESVTWFGSSARDIYSDSSVFRKSAVVTFLRGVRFWYMAKVVPSPCRSTRPANAIECHTFVARSTETFTELLAKVNDQLSQHPSGRILNVETVKMHVIEDAVHPELTFWREDVSDTKQVVFAFRVYTQLVATPTRQTIGYQDFVPCRTNRSKENRGYELYADVMDRAARWIARQQGVRFTNTQTVSTKMKTSDLSFEERCKYTEHGRRVTNFLSVIRAYFVIEQESGPGTSIPSARLTYRTFSPAQLNPVTVNQPAKYEDTRSVLERVNHWLQITGASLFSMETLPVRMTTGNQQVLGAEATFLQSQDSGSMAGKYLFHIRIYLNGDYVEPPGAVNLVSPQLTTYSY